MLKLALLALLSLARAHDVGTAGNGHEAVQARAEDESLSYAERHMAAEHHIEDFDLASFFKLHDLDMDGKWDKDEIAALYGLRHHSVHGKKSKFTPADEARIVKAVLQKLDKDGDGKISLVEYQAGGKDALPVMGDFKDLGHHYDEESEYFLHHEELYHSTPETQTDESYNHAEDIEHFRHHQHIEAEEEAREKAFEGLPAKADLEDEHAAPADPLDEHAHAEGEGPEAYAEAGEGPDAGHPENVAGSQEEAAQARFQFERMRREPKKRIQAQAESGRHRHSHEDRAKPGAPYTKMRAGLRSDEF